MDKRFIKKQDAEKYFVDMCALCGLCCWARDWSTEWLGKRSGICGNLDTKTGKCIDERKKSIKCRVCVCESMDQYLDWVRMARKIGCPTAMKMIQEMILRKMSHFTDEELAKIQKILQGEL